MFDYRHESPFERLRRHPVGGKDPREDRATETLAACLDLSLVLRAEFFRLLRVETSEAGAWRVQTQVVPAADSRWDLHLLSSDLTLEIVIECKVGDRLRETQVGKSDKIIHRWKKYYGHREPTTEINNSEFDAEKLETLVVEASKELAATLGLFA